MDRSVALKLVEPEPDYSVRRSFDAADINAILNHPDVFPDVAVPGVETFDMGPILSDPRNVLLTGAGGVILFDAKTTPGVYDVHTYFYPTHRGKNAVEVSRSAYRWMFIHTDCTTLQTYIPAFNRAAIFAARKVGFRFEFMRKGAWPTKDGSADLEFYAMSYRDWLWSTPELVVSGHAFHDKFDAERKRLGKTEARNHPDDEAHEIAAGACAEMMLAGNYEKAVMLYNGWAEFSGYAPIKLISRSPAMCDIGDGLIQIADNDFKVILVR